MSFQIPPQNEGEGFAKERAAHTPAPWNIYVADYGRRFIETDFRALVATCERLPETEANARLIAAAPELLEALEAAAIRLEILERKYTGGTDWCTSLARAAIAKAKDGAA